LSLHQAEVLLRLLVVWFGRQAAEEALLGLAEIIASALVAQAAAQGNSRTIATATRDLRRILFTL
jgi:hypothetical protein